MNRRNAVGAILVSGFGMFFYIFSSRCSKSVENRKLNAADFNLLIADIAETIIPRTDTPGAKDAGVSRYIINVIDHCVSLQEKNNFIDGLVRMERYCLNNYELGFSDLNNRTKNQVVSYLEKRGSFNFYILERVRRKLFGRTFFQTIKLLTSEGYCNSQLGATVGLAYLEVPVNYIACVPFTTNQRAWALK